MRRAAALACLAAAACQTPSIDNPFYAGPDPARAVEFDTVLAEPGVFAGREIVLTGDFQEFEGQACLTDRGRRLALRLNAHQAEIYRGMRNWPVTVRGVFSQAICPPGRVCPAMCAPYGLEAGAEIIPQSTGR